MVGVPGKSKGCITCRRRKIRCDEGQPDCQRCIRSGRECEGYETYPTFLNQTVHGPQKRYGLEEAKPRLSVRGESSPSILSRRSSSSGSRISRQASNSDLYDAQLISQFWESFAPVGHTAQNPSVCEWLERSIESPNQTVALQLSIKALAVTRVGWKSNDTALTTRGHAIYGNALKELQKALWDEKTMWLDETLAAAYALSVYELFENTTNDIRGWNSHMTGIGLVIRLRGPQRHQGPLGRSILEVFRYSSMIQSMQYRKSSFFLEEPWRALKLGDSMIDPNLVESGFQLAALQDEADQHGLQTGDLDTARIDGYVRRLADIDQTLGSQWVQLVGASTSPLYWVSNELSYPTLDEETQASIRGTESSDPPNIEAPFAFSSLQASTNATLYWALKILIAATRRQITNAARAEPAPATTQPSPPRFDEITAPSLLPTSQIRSQNPLIFYSARTASATNPHPPLPPQTNLPIQYTMLILRAAPFIIHPDQNSLGPQRSLFPLRIALFILRVLPTADNPLLELCKRMYAIVSERRGVRYAREIAKHDGGHGTRGNERWLAGGVTPAGSPAPMPSQGPYAVVEDLQEVETTAEEESAAAGPSRR